MYKTTAKLICSPAIVSLKQAFSLFPTGVTIVTAWSHSSLPVGLTISSFGALSMDPPLALWSLRNTSGCCPIFLNAESHAIHILSSDQRALAERFASKTNDPFKEVEWKDKKDGSAPEICNSLVRFDCTTQRVYEEGDHFLFISFIRSFQLFSGEALVRQAGQYLKLQNLIN